MRQQQHQQQQQHPTITTITAPLPPLSSPPPPYSHTLSSSFFSSSSSSSSTSSSASNLSSNSPLASTSFPTTNKNPLHRHTIMQQPQQRHSILNDEFTSPTSPRPYTLIVLSTTTSSSSSKPPSSLAPASPSLSPIESDVSIAMTMNPRKYVPHPPAELRIRPSTTTTPPSSSFNRTNNNNKNSTATFSNASSGCSSNLDKILPSTPPKRVTSVKATALLKLKGLKTRLRTHSFSSSTFSFPTSSHDRQHSVLFPISSSISNRSSSSSTVSTTRESVAQEYARIIKTLWKMVEDEEQAHRLVEASHSLSGCIPTIADISPGTSTGTGRVVNRPSYVGTMAAALRRPSLPLLKTVLPIQEEEETSTISTTSPTRMPFSPRPSSGLQRHHHAVSLAILDKTPLPTTTKRNTFPLMISSTNEMDHIVADLEVSPVGFSDASEEDSGEDSEEEEERAVVHIAQKISVYRGRSFCWSQPA